MKNKYLFIVGLHRSGTTALAEILSSHKDVSSFKNTGYPMDEGQFLQSVYPIGAVHGGPGMFGFNQESHLTEISSLISKKNIIKLHQEWDVLWDKNKKILLEKSPPNLLKMRFLQKIFPNSYFIILLRHPIVVSYATQKWSKTSLVKLLQHWIHSYQIAFEDLKFIDNCLVLYYEDLFSNPDKELTRISSFIKIDNLFDKSIINSEMDFNKKYFEFFDEERKFLSVSEKINLYFLEFQIKKFGYSLKNKNIHERRKYFEK